MRTKGSECKSQVLTPQSDSQKKRRRAVDRATQELQDKIRIGGVNATGSRSKRTIMIKKGGQDDLGVQAKNK